MYLLLEKTYSVAFKDGTKGRVCILLDETSFLKKRSILKKVSFPEPIHLPGDASDVHFASSVTARCFTVAQNLGKHFYRITFNFKLHLKVFFYTFIHILFKYSDRTMSNFTDYLVVQKLRNLFHFSPPTPHSSLLPL